MGANILRSLTAILALKKNAAKRRKFGFGFPKRELLVL